MPPFTVLIFLAKWFSVFQQYVFMFYETKTWKIQAISKINYIIHYMKKKSEPEILSIHVIVC